ncbi:MAG: hypothetical protein LBS55_06510 [Prevotellaceae bacterium]|jgi:hypothetical protein|nr:hypothetical protein [Prevotellaceae bacterium]
MALKTIVDIKQIFYANPIASITSATAGLSGVEVYALIHHANTKEVENVHATTWQYNEDEPSTTNYVNQLNGKTYYIDTTPGATNVGFSIGQYDYQAKAELQGGKATATSWERPESQGLIYKSIVAVTKDNTHLVFPKAQITARGGMIEDKAIGLLLTATPIDTGIAGLASEKWFDASEIVSGE